MADITFYKYLEAAFRYRLLNPEGKKATLKTHFNYLGYNLPFERIFHYARRVLPSLYALQFPNTEEGNLRMAKKVLDALDRKLDTQLERYFDPAKTPVEYQQLIDEAQSESQQAEAAGQSTGGESAETMGMPGLPSAPSIRSTPRITRIIQNIPQTPEPPKPEIVVANSSGVIREAGDPSKLVATNSSGVIKEAGDPSKLVKATRTGEIVEEGQPSKLVTTGSSGAVKEVGEPSKLVTTNKSGAITEAGKPSELVTTSRSGIVKETPPSKIYIPQNRSGVPVGERPIPPSSASARFNFRNFKLPGTFVNTMKNFGSAAGRFFQRNMGKFFTVGRIGTAVSAGIGAVAGAGFGPIGSLAGAAGGGIGSFWIKSGDGARFLGKAANKGLNAFEKLSKPGLKGASGSFGSFGSKKLVWGLFLGMFFFVFSGIIGGITGTAPTGKAAPVPAQPIAGAGCPDTSTNRDDASCRYLNPPISLFDTSISQSGINSYIEKYKSQFVGLTISDGTTGTEDEFKKRVNAIVSKAQQVGLNPAILLGLWKSESNFSTIGRAGNDLGCRPNHPEITTFDEDLLCAVGQKSEGKTYEPSVTIQCVLSRDANSDSCNSLRAGRASAGYDTTRPLNYPITTFDNFMEAYGPYGHLSSDGKHTNCTHTYNTVLDIAKEAEACKLTTPLVAGGGSSSICSGTPISLDIPKKFLPKPEDKATCLGTQTEACGRPGTCVSNPTRIVLHTTAGTLDAEGTYQYFANGSGGRGVGSHFIIGKDGQTLQLVETLENKIEVAWAVANYADHISLEIVHSGVYSSKAEAPAVQYQATIDLVKKLMHQYNIPVGNIDYDWRANGGRSDDATSEATTGVYGHYQLNPVTRGDPGVGFLRDFRADLK